MAEKRRPQGIIGLFGVSRGIRSVDREGDLIRSHDEHYLYENLEEIVSKMIFLSMEKIGNLPILCSSPPVCLTLAR
jgi:hypothetical protein